MKRLPIAVLALACAFTSCKKDNEDPAPAKTKTELLTAKSWRASAAVATFTSGTNTMSIDVYGGVDPNTKQPYTPACSKDDFLKFSADKTVLFDEGGSRCNSNDPQTIKNAWDFTSNESKLLLSETTSSSTSDLFEILELTATTLKMRQSETDQGETLTYTVTYTAF